MRNPSVKTLTTYLGITEEKAEQIRSIMQYGANERNLEAIDEVLGTHGVEYIPRGNNQRSPGIAYCNTGETYQSTVMLIDGNFRVGCWGDIVERGNYD